MAQTRAAVETYTVLPDGTTTKEGVDADQERSYDEFRASVSGSESDIKAWVWKVPEDKDGQPRAGKLEFLFSEPIDKYTMDDILKVVREEWMVPGVDTRWHIRIHVRDKTSIRLNTLLVVRKAKSAADARVQSQLSETLEAVQKMVDANLKRTEDMLSSRAPAAAAPQLDMGQMMQWMFAQQAEARKEAQANKNQEMQNLALLLQAMRPAQGGSSDLLSMVKTMREVKDFSEELAPGVSRAVSGEGGFTDIAKAVAPFVPLLTSLVNRNGPAVTRALPAPEAAAAAPAAAAPVFPPQHPPFVPAAPQSPPVLKVVPTPEPTEEQKQMIGNLREQLGALAEIAAEKPDPKQVVATLLPNLPETYDDLIYSTLISDNWFEQLSTLQPKIKPHHEWFKSLRDEWLKAYNPPQP
jgi:hypothetical protein